MEGISIIKLDLASAGADRQDWVRIRHELYQDGEAVLDAQLAQLQALGVIYVAFLARTVEGVTIAFAEAALRPYANGCESSNVAFLEGIYVQPAFRGRGLARRLVGEVENWARSRGCVEIGSDARLENTISHEMHIALGFKETGKTVNYCRRLDLGLRDA